MPKIKVLVVDDAVVIRKILTDTLAADPEIEVVGTAPNGKIALQKIPQLNPDIITLDIEMPELDGLSTLPLIRKDYPKIPVIMFSSLTLQGAASTLEALARGASDYVTKPANVGSVTASREAVRDELISKVKALTRGSTGSGSFNSLGAASKQPSSIKIAPVSFTKASGSIEAITIGVSTGGPNALAAIMPALPENLSVPIFIVQHMPPMFTRLLAERLDAQSKLHVVEAEHNQEVKAGTVYIAPGNYHLEVVRTLGKVFTKLQQEQQENSCRPAVDVLFRSVARTYGGKTLAVVLTGMGRDGLNGCEVLKEAGAEVIAQDKPSSVVWGMPGYVAEAGLADAVLPLDNIPQEIIRRVSHARTLSLKPEAKKLTEKRP